jgi:hypothetical protein
VMRCIQVSHALLDEGYLVRGGIAIGPLWHNSANIVGPAYQQAYALEGGTKDRLPRIVLSPSATALWKSGGPSTGSRMCIDYDGAFMVNGLHDYYVPEQYRSNLQQAFTHYEALAISALNSGLGPREAQKWNWMKQYIADERRLSCP